MYVSLELRKCGFDKLWLHAHTHPFTVRNYFVLNARRIRFLFLSINFTSGLYTNAMQSCLDGHCSPYDDRINIKIVLHGTRGDDEISNAWRMMLCRELNRQRRMPSAECYKRVAQKKIPLYAWRVDAPCSVLGRIFAWTNRHNFPSRFASVVLVAWFSKHSACTAAYRTSVRVVCCRLWMFKYRKMKMRIDAVPWCVCSPRFISAAAIRALCVCVVWWTTTHRTHTHTQRPSHAFT